jgi:hypothetical protein
VNKRKAQKIDNAVAKLQKTDAARRANIPKHLRLTPEILAESTDNQQAWAEAANSPFAGLSPAMADYARSGRLIEEWSQSRNQVMGKMIMASKEESEALNNAYNNSSRNLAEAYAMAGLFAEAAGVHPDEATRAEYLAIAEAVARDDDDSCTEKCQPIYDLNPTTLGHHESEVRHVWSVKHKSIMTLFRCNVCGGLNVKPAPAAVTAAKQRRAQALEITKGMSPAQARAALTKAELTSATAFRR